MRYYIINEIIIKNLLVIFSIRADKVCIICILISFIFLREIIFNISMKLYSQNNSCIKGSFFSPYNKYFSSV